MSKYPKEMLEPIVRDSKCIRDVLRQLGIKLTGGSHSHIKGLIEKYELDSSHFLGHAFKCGQQSNSNKRPWPEILVLRESDRRQAAHVLRRALLESGRVYACVDCGNTGVWNGKPLVLEIDHKNGNWIDDRPDNLDFRCPNCHGQKTCPGTQTSGKAAILRES